MCWTLFPSLGRYHLFWTSSIGVCITFLKVSMEEKGKGVWNETWESQALNDTYKTFFSDVSVSRNWFKNCVKIRYCTVIDWSCDLHDANCSAGWLKLWSAWCQLFRRLIEVVIRMMPIVPQVFWSCDLHDANCYAGLLKLVCWMCRCVNINRGKKKSFCSSPSPPFIVKLVKFLKNRKIVCLLFLFLKTTAT